MNSRLPIEAQLQAALRNLEAVTEENELFRERVESIRDDRDALRARLAVLTEAAEQVVRLINNIEDADGLFLDAAGILRAAFTN